ADRTARAAVHRVRPAGRVPLVLRRDPADQDCRGGHVSQQRTAVVTGAAGGIGAAISRRLAADGFSVACVDLKEPDVTAPLRAYAADVRDAGSVAAVATRIRSELGEPWLLVNAAGVFSIQLLPDLDEQEWDRILDTNLKGPFLTCREFLPAMIAATSGCVVNIASTAGVRGGRR